MSPTVHSEPPDFLRSGRPSLDLAWTVRFRNVWPTETLVDTEALIRWLRATYPGVTFNPRLVTDEFLAELTHLREAIYALVRASIADEPWRRRDVSLVNRHADGPRFRHRLGGNRAVRTTVTDAGQFLAELAVDGIAVLSADPSRLKLCEGPDCALPFLDESRGASRRWCTAQRCGNRVNTKAYRRRLKA